jgi:hypothetical protein
MTVTKEYLERRVISLNKWLQDPQNDKHDQFRQNVHKRNYYVNKLIELEENNLNSIKI